jgi:penicillin-binding protein 1A
MPAPPEVESLNGELYFDSFLPGQGFVTSLGVPAATELTASEQHETAIGPNDVEPVAVQHPLTAEGERAMNLLEGH